MNIKRNILLTPGPLTTRDEVKRALLTEDICPREKDFTEVLREVRESVVKVAHGEKDYSCVLYASSGTGAVEAAISSVLESDSEKILVLDNGAYGARMAAIARASYGPARVVHAEFAHTRMLSAADVENRLEADPTIRVVALVHHETTTGMLNAIEDVGRAVRKRGVKIIVDAMSSFGGLPIDLRRDAYDFVISSANKCLESVPGMAFVVARTAWLNMPSKQPSKSFYFDLRRGYAYVEKTGQMEFTAPVQVVYAFREALRLYFKETGEGRNRRYMQSWDVLTAGLKHIGFKLLLPEAHQSRLLASILEPSHPRFDFDAMHDDLFKHGFTIYPGKTGQHRTFRLAVIGAIDSQDIAEFLKELQNHLNRREIRIEETPPRS